MLTTLISFVVVIGVVIFVHELGHFLGLEEDDLLSRDLV